MIGPSGNVRVYLACGVTDMRRGIVGLSALVETEVKEAPGSGAIFGFRGKRADRIKLLWWTGREDACGLAGRMTISYAVSAMLCRFHVSIA